MKDKKTLSNKKNSSSRIEAFLEDFQEYERNTLTHKAEDDFLDAYSCWLKTKALKDKLEAIRKGMRFEAINPQFSLAFLFPLK